jgi:hypothetical protein
MQDDKYKKHVDSKSEIQKEIPQDKHADWVLAIWSPKGEPQAKEEGDSIKDEVTAF